MTPSLTKYYETDWIISDNTFHTHIIYVAIFFSEKIPGAPKLELNTPAIQF
jgi:hypothetical protein